MSHTFWPTPGRPVSSACLLQLPDEILLFILRQLDFVDQVNVFETCRRLSVVMSERNVLRQPCRLGCGPLATADSLRRPLFMKLGYLIKELDLSCVWNLSRTKLVPALKRMKNLTSLDISQTDICLFDLPHVSKACPNLKKIRFNIDYSIEQVAMGADVVKPLLNLEVIHLVSNNPALSGSAHPFVQHMVTHTFKNLKEVHFTANGTDSLFFRYVHMFMQINCKVASFHSNFETVSGSVNLNLFNDWEYIFIERYVGLPRIRMSSNLYDKYCAGSHTGKWQVYEMKPHTILTLNHIKWSWYLWHRDIVEYNENFYDEILRKLENNIVNSGCLRIKSGYAIKFNEHSSTSYYLSACTFVEQNNTNEPPTKKRYSRLKNLAIKLEGLVQPDREIKLTVGFDCSAHSGRYHPNLAQVRLNPGSSIMANVTFLHLNGLTNIDKTFYRILFKECVKLKTLNVDNENLTTSTLLLWQNISLAKTLANLRVKGAEIINSKLYHSLATCPSLENVHICDIAVDNNANVPEESLLIFVNRCTRLYSFQLYSAFNSAAQAEKQMKVIKNANSNIYVKFHHFINSINSLRTALSTDPYIDIFFYNSVYKSLCVNFKFPPTKSKES